MLNKCTETDVTYPGVPITKTETAPLLYLIIKTHWYGMHVSR